LGATSQQAQPIFAAACSSKPKRPSADGARASPGMALLEESPPPHWHLQID